MLGKKVGKHMPRVAYVFGKKLAAARNGLAITQRELGEAIGGVSDETISRVERNEVAGILAKRLPKLAAALGMSLEEFKTSFCPPLDKLHSDAAAAKAGLPAGLNMRRVQPARIVPEFPIGIAANRRVDKLADYPEANRLVATADRRAFTAPVDGDCQHPKWKHGEIVVFSYDAVEREGILPGKSYYIAFTDGSTTFKRVFFDERDPEIYILRCWNRKKYPQDQRVHRDEIVRIARAMSKHVAVDEDAE
jgi:transcriptional regulator with XRE-family HTH domain